MHQGLIFVNTVDHQRAAPSNEVDAIVGQLLHTSSLNHDIKPVRVVVLQFLPLRIGALAVELDVLVTRVEVFGDVHLDALVRCNHDAGGAVELEELGQDEPSWAGPEHEHFDSDGGVELVESVDGACRRFKEGRLFIGEIVDLVEFFLLAITTE